MLPESLSQLMAKTECLLLGFPLFWAPSSHSVLCTSSKPVGLGSCPWTDHLGPLGQPEFPPWFGVQQSCHPQKHISCLMCRCSTGLCCNLPWDGVISNRCPQLSSVSFSLIRAVVYKNLGHIILNCPWVWINNFFSSNPISTEQTTVTIHKP